MLLASDLPNFSTFGVYRRPGWEIATDLVAFDVEGAIANTPVNPPDYTPTVTEVYRGWNIYSYFEVGASFPKFYAQKGTVTSPKFDYIYKCKTWIDQQEGGMWLSIFKFDPASNLQHDFDNPAWGMPDIIATAGDVREEMSAWPYAPLESDVGNYKYVTTYHEYLFDVQIKTLADMSSVDANGTRVWTHETSMPFQYQTQTGAGGIYKGKEIKGKVYVRFSTLPWGFLDYGPIPDNYSATNVYWLGVMNAKCEEIDTGLAAQNIDESDVIDKGWARGIESTGGPLNMMDDDGTFAVPYAKVPWDANKVLDPDIQSTIIVELPFDMMAGAIPVWDRWAFMGGGAIAQCKPVDYYLTYTVRMECLVVKEYAARDPGLPANPSRIDPPQDYVGYQIPSFWDKYGLWIIIGAVLVIVLIILTWLGLPLLFFMGGR